MNVLIITNSINGLYNFRKELIEKLIFQKYNVIISAPKNEKTTYFEQMGCECVTTNIDRRGTNPITDIKLFIIYLKLLKIVKPDVVLTYTIKPNVYGGFACGLLKIPYIANITGLGTSLENNGLIKNVSLRLSKIGLRNAECVFFQNDENRAFFNKNNIAINKNKLIPGSGVNLEEHAFKEYPKNDSEINILFIGRIMSAKGVDELLHAAKIIKRKHPYVNFNLIGRCEENYTNKLKALKKNGIINYFGYQSDVRYFIQKCDAVINPSHHEGMSNVLLEAASTGRPVLASNIPGCRETFDDNVSGIGFNAKDPDSLIAAIEKFIKLPYEQKKEMGIAGRKKMEKEFDRNIVIDSYIEEIDRILSEDK